MNQDLNELKRDFDALLAELRIAGAEGSDAKHLRCPWHDDQRGSLSAYTDKDGVARFKCQAASCNARGTIIDVVMKSAGCTAKQAIESLTGSARPAPALKPAPAAKKAPRVYATREELRDAVEAGAKAEGGRLASVYAYVNPKTGKPDLWTIRIELPNGKKRFELARPETDGEGFVRRGVEIRPLYRRLEIAPPHVDTVWVVEGEKCADAVAEFLDGVTTSPEGAGRAKQADWSPLSGKAVVIWPDNDDSGAKYALDVIDMLRALPELPLSIRIIDPKPLNLGAGGDVADFIERLKADGKQNEEILANLLDVQDGAKDAPLTPPSGEGLSPLIPLIPQSAGWPKLGDEALYGLAGEFVRAVEPHSEADPVALLIQFLIAFGSVMGRTAYAAAEADRHYTNEFAVLVGASSKGRKGTSWGHIHRALESVDAEWATNHIERGLSSGEGLIWRVKDPEQMGKDADPGVTDKRLFLIESEFANLLKVMDRPGNTLSPVIRNSWDSGTLRILTKNSPAKATGAHVSIIGHVTATELKRLLNETEAGNGFANRFLWLCVKRSRLLPEGGCLPAITMEGLYGRIGKAVEFSKTQGEVRRNAAAREMWAKVYRELAEETEGMAGALTSRAEAHVLRLSVLYALLDLSPEVRPEHLAAGYSLWRYSAASVLHIFGATLGDPTADQVLLALKGSPEGLSRTDIDKLLGKHARPGEIARALDCLARSGRAHFQRIGTAGRPAERWFGAGPAEKAEKAEKGGAP